MRRISLMFGVFASLMVLLVLVSSYRLAGMTKSIRGRPFYDSIMIEFLGRTYISTCVEPPLCGNGILSGADQAMNPKMKINTKPALHASANIGLRAPVDGSIILWSYVRFPLQRAKERQEEAAAMAGCAKGWQTNRRPNGHGGLALLKGPISRQPSGQACRSSMSVSGRDCAWRKPSALRGVDAQPKTRC